MPFAHYVTMALIELILSMGMCSGFSARRDCTFLLNILSLEACVRAHLTWMLTFSVEAV